ncbi:MAG: serine/threonine-protein kinase, partial [Rhodovulum sp.]
MNAAPDIQNHLPADGPVEELQPGTELLHGQYRIERFLNAGGFGLTYLARDSLDRTVVIKECFPESLCLRTGQDVHARSRSYSQEFHSIVQLFIDEAHRLARLSHPGIVGVHQVFSDNTTAYMALDYIEGKTLLEVIEDPRETPTPAAIRAILVKVLDAVAFIHDQSLLHRDISPDNIIIGLDGSPVLIDFGAARERATRNSRVLSRLQVVKDGYSPQEFYVAGIKQGPPSDLYALAATFYHLIAGEAPPSSQQRMAALAANEPDPCEPLQGRVPGYDPAFLAAIDRALNVVPRERPQSAHDWLTAIETGPREAAVGEVLPIDDDTRVSIARLVEETNRAVMEARQRSEQEARAPE